VSPELDKESYYIFLTPAWKAVVSVANGCLDRAVGGITWCDSQGRGKVYLPVEFIKFYETYQDFLKENVEGETKAKIAKRDQAKRIAASKATEQEDQDETKFY
jgi:hypothetical protein